MNTFSEENSIGLKSCKSKRLCGLSDTDYFEEPYLVQENNKYNFEYKFKLNPLSICDKTNLNSLEKEFTNYPDKIVSNDFEQCNMGLCLENYNQTESKKFICTPCKNQK